MNILSQENACLLSFAARKLSSNRAYPCAGAMQITEDTIAI
jgi:hypothetical protein